MKKRIEFLILALLVAVCLVLPVSAAGDAQLRIIDEYGIFDSDTQDWVMEAGKDFSVDYGCDVYCLVVGDIGNMSAREFAKEYYIDYELGCGALKSGILLLIAVDSCDYATITYGLGVTTFTDYRIEKIEDAVVPFLSDGDYQTAAETHIRMCVETLQFMDVQGEALDSHNDPETSWIASIVKLAIVLLVPAIIAGLVCFLFYRQMKTAVQKTQADDYIPVGGFVLTHKADNYTHTTEVRVYDPPKKAASSGSSKDSSGFDGSKGGKF